jgi:hypothetical protein
MTNPFAEYYTQQAGSGLTGFEGVRYQKGHGFFGRLLSKAIYPLLRFLGKQAFNTGINVASDVIEKKKNWRQSAKERMKETGKNVAKAGLDRARLFQQTGEGRRKKRGRKKKSNHLFKAIKRKPKRRIKKKKSIKRRKKRRSSVSALHKLMKNVRYS